MIYKKEIEDKIRDCIRDISGGHSLESLSGEKLWLANDVINITALAELFIKETLEKESILIELLNKIWEAQSVAVLNGGGAFQRHVVPAINESRKVLKEIKGE